MIPRLLTSAIALIALSVPSSLSAQTMVTFEMPVKLTQLAPEILKVGMYCDIKSQAIVSPNPGLASATDEVSVVGGQLITTMRVVITLPSGSLQAPAGKTANYTCYLTARTATGLGGFTDATGPNPATVLTPNPPPVTGSFTW